MKTENQSSSINLFLFAILLVFFELSFSYPSEKKKVRKGYTHKNYYLQQAAYMNMIANLLWGLAHLCLMISTVTILTILYKYLHCKVTNTIGPW